MAMISDYAASHLPVEDVPPASAAVDPPVGPTAESCVPTLPAPPDPMDNSAPNMVARLAALIWRRHIDPEDAEYLADLAGNRIVVLTPRGPAGVSYATLLSILLAIIFDGSVAAILIYGAFFWKPPTHYGSRGGGVMIPADGATAVGGIMQRESTALPRRTTLAAHTWTGTIPRPPQLHAGPTATSALAMANLLRSGKSTVASPQVIGLPSPGTVWSGPPVAVETPIHPRLKVHTPARTAPPPPRSRGPRPDPAYFKRSRNGIDPNAGFGSPLSLIKGEHFSRSGSEGLSHGRGRGISAFDNPRPQVLQHPDPVIPLKYEFQPPPHSPVLRVTVLPDGRAGNIKVIHSSGAPTVDQACVDAVRGWRFFPAIKDGKKIKSHFTVKFPEHGY